ncbi:MAG: winged helix-turn-helix transcriptional regulator [Thaumarchaeota archaeon]|nr:winged helix-turn-helix transcriptional regulator [Nitrososphaerota archaeon]
MDRASEIIQVIESNPGIQFREIMRKTGLKNGVLEHYSSKLERDGVVKIERSPGQTRFYPLGLSDCEMCLIKNLRRETPRQILSLLLQYDLLSFGEMVDKAKKSPATISLYLAHLEEERIVEIRFINSKRKYRLAEKDKLRDVIERYHPSIIESSADHLADTFSSL